VAQPVELSKSPGEARATAMLIAVEPARSFSPAQPSVNQEQPVVSMSPRSVQSDTPSLEAVASLPQATSPERSRPDVNSLAAGRSYTLARSLNVRAAPDIKSALIWQADVGTTLIAGEPAQQPGWRRVAIPGRQGGFVNEAALIRALTPESHSARTPGCVAAFGPVVAGADQELARYHEQIRLLRLGARESQIQTCRRLDLILTALQKKIAAIERCPSLDNGAVRADADGKFSQVMGVKAQQCR